MQCFCNNIMEFCKINDHELFICPNCGHIRKKNILKEELQKERYDKHICDDGYLKYMNKVYNKISRYLNPGVSLDYGCGQIHALSDIMNDNNNVCDYYDLFYYNQIKKDIYDNIILIEVIEHIEDVKEEILKIKEMLADKGKIIIMTNFIPDNINNWWYLRDTTHVSFLNESSILKLGIVVDMDVMIDKENNIFVLTKKA